MALVKIFQKIAEEFPFIKRNAEKSEACTRPQEKAESPLRPAAYFNPARWNSLKDSLQKSGIEVTEKDPSPTINFMKGGKPYTAKLAVEPEKNPMNYLMHVEIFTESGKKIFEKDRQDLAHLQVEPAIIFAFHQPFTQ